jgi:hypothetical protein
MAIVTLKKTKLKSLLLVEKQYELFPEILTLVMQYFAPPVENDLYKLTLPELSSLSTKVFARGIKNVTNKTKIPIEERKLYYIKPLMKYHSKNDLLKKYSDQIIKHSMTKFKVGDTINYTRFSGAMCFNTYGGIVVKITDKNLRIQLYQEQLIKIDQEARINRDMGYDIYSWNPAFCEKVKVRGLISVSSSNVDLVHNFEIQVRVDHWGGN